MYLHCLLEKTLSRVQKAFPAVVLTGPRQSGKSTLLRRFLASRKPTILPLDDPQTRALMAEDPLSYLKRLPKPVVLDEIQYYPDITIYVKMLVDADRKPGLWFLTGSQQFALMRHVSESMAGRAAILTLPPLQLRERKKAPALGGFMAGPSYPEPLLAPKSHTALWYSSYLQTYLERDVRAQLAVSDIRDFEQLIRLLAARTAQVLNYSDLAGPLGLSVPTVKRWVSTLSAGYIIHLLQPYHENFGKRILKAPKIYFYDPGLVAYLLRLDQGPPVQHGPMAGALFENAVVSEMLKAEWAKGTRPEFYYWHSQSEMEVDLLVPGKGGYDPVEIKLTSRLKPDHARNLKYWLELSGRKRAVGTLITDSREEYPGLNIRNRHWEGL
jgi:predicted AAA+ superfamily ATPase